MKEKNIMIGVKDIHSLIKKWGEGRKKG